MLHTGDFHKRGVHSSEAAMTCWASLYEAVLQSSEKQVGAGGSISSVDFKHSSWQGLVGKEPRKVTQEEFHADQPAV